MTPYVALICICLMAANLFGQTSKCLTPKQLDRLLPKKIEGFRDETDPRSIQTKVGNLVYTLAERNLKTKTGKVKLLLFDYVEAPVMFQQATKQWTAMPQNTTDSTSFIATLSDSVSTWRSVDRVHGRDQLVITLYKRYLINITSQGLADDQLNQLVRLIEPSKFPK